MGGGGPCDYCVTPVPIGLGFGFWTALGLGLGLRGPDLGLGLDNFIKCRYVIFKKVEYLFSYKFHLIFAPVNLMTRVEEGDSGLDETPNRGKFAIYVLNFLEVSDSMSVAFIRG